MHPFPHRFTPTRGRICRGLLPPTSRRSPPQRVGDLPRPYSLQRPAVHPTRVGNLGTCPAPYANRVHPTRVGRLGTAHARYNTPVHPHTVGICESGSWGCLLSGSPPNRGEIGGGLAAAAVGYPHRVGRLSYCPASTAVVLVHPPHAWGVIHTAQLYRVVRSPPHAGEIARPKAS